VDDLGPPIAYTALEEGTPVLDRSGRRIGVVEHVLADWQADIFEGLVIHTRPIPGKDLYADVEQVAELHERGVVLSVERDVLYGRPGKAPRGDRAENALEARVRRAWEWISGRG
jgi:uncharacterized protein YrrD